MAQGGYQTAVHNEQGGAKRVIADAGTIEIQSGGAIDVLAGGAIKADGTQASNIADLTDSSGGTASDTIAAITAGGSYAQADMTAVKNALASLTAKFNALNAAVQGVGITASA